jgi:peptide chain release factor 3
MLKDPLRLKALGKGLDQLCEEGATQLFRPLISNDLILGAVGPLQFDVATFRLRDEYGVECQFEGVNVAAARWVDAPDRKRLDEFKNKLKSNLAEDHAGQLVYLAPSIVSLRLTQERWPEIRFHTTREHAAGGL